MVYFESPVTDPYFNLALEEYFFDQMDRTKSYFMLWQNDKAIVVGKYQNTEEEINREFVEAQGIRVVRRLSGGGAVYHDKGNLNFTFILDQAEIPDFNFKLFIRPVIRALDMLGVSAQFNSRNDITINGKKFCGNSQYMRKGRILHHGCIMLDSNLDNVTKALMVKDAKFESKSVKSVRSRVTTINENATKAISMEVFKHALLECVKEETSLERCILTEADIAAVQALRDKKYMTWEWNYGASPPYNVCYEKKFAAGLIQARLQIEEGFVKTLRFSGDFFGKEEIRLLENAIVGTPFGEGLKEKLLSFDVGKYINGFSTEELCQLLGFR